MYRLTRIVPLSAVLLAIFTPLKAELPTTTTVTAIRLDPDDLHRSRVGELIWRGGVEAVPKGQWDAGAALGLRPFQQLRKVVLPQAFAYVRAPTVGFLVQLIKSTAVTSIIGFQELLRVAGTINNATFEPFTVYSVVAVIYFLLCFPLTWYARVLERRDARS